MTEYLETTGKTEEEAIAVALEKLGLERDDISVEVLNRAKSGFLGFGASPAKIRVSYQVPEEKPDPKIKENLEKQEKEEKERLREKVKEEAKEKLAQRKEEAKQEAIQEEKQEVLQVESQTVPPEKEDIPAEILPEKSEKQQKKQSKPGGKEEKSKTPDYRLTPEEVKDLSKKIETYLLGLLSHLHVEAKVQVNFDGKDFKVNICGEEGVDLGTIIGRRGDTLDAIQQLTTYTMRRQCPKRLRIFVDAENFREKRVETLEKLAVKVAGQVVKTKKNVTLEPMNAYERHIIHVAVENNPEIYTYSVGNDPNRKIVIALKK